MTFVGFFWHNSSTLLEAERVNADGFFGYLLILFENDFKEFVMRNDGAAIGVIEVIHEGDGHGVLIFEGGDRMCDGFVYLVFYFDDLVRLKGKRIGLTIHYYSLRVN